MTGRRWEARGGRWELGYGRCEWAERGRRSDAAESGGRAHLDEDGGRLDVDEADGGHQRRLACAKPILGRRGWRPSAAAAALIATLTEWVGGAPRVSPKWSAALITRLDDMA